MKLRVGLAARPGFDKLNQRQSGMLVGLPFDRLSERDTRRLSLSKPEFDNHNEYPQSALSIEI